MKILEQKGFATILVPILVVVIIAAGSFFYFTRPQTSPIPKYNPLNTQPASQPLFLKLESPSQETSAVDDTVLIKGQTLPNTTVAMFNEADEATIQSDQNGNFESKLLLGQGDNNLTITAFGDDDQEKTLNLRMSYNPGT